MLEFLRDSLSIYAGTQYIYQDFLNLVMIQILPLECWDYREISLIQFSILSLIQKFFKYSHIVRYCLIFYFHCFIVLGISIKFLSKFELEYILKIRHRILSLYMMWSLNFQGYFVSCHFFHYMNLYNIFMLYIPTKVGHK